MTLWWHLDDPAKIRAANASYAVLLRDATWSRSAKRLARTWERISVGAANDPERFYTAMLATAFKVTSACWGCAANKAHLIAWRSLLE